MANKVILVDMKEYKTFKEFYSYYLEEHKDKRTKLFHFIGTSLSITFLIRLFINLELINLLYALLVGYGFAWISHLFIEKNKPATFAYPLYSLMGDFKMFWEILMGRHKVI